MGEIEIHRVTFVVEVEKGIDVFMLVDEALEDMQVMDGVISITETNIVENE